MIKNKPTKSTLPSRSKLFSAMLVANAMFLPLLNSVSVQAADGAIEEIFVSIGSRVPGRSNTDLAVPVDALDADALKKTGQTEVGRMLQSLTPSFNFSSSSISDGTDALRPATLRGLGPDQTLVLVNGKRRHTSALIHVNTSVGRGTSGTDLNAIPAASIKRIEVLRDGAAAQYGSDAIAGVINIILNDDAEAGNFSISRGEYSFGDGETTNLDLSKGFALGENGYVNATLNYRDRGSSNRAGLSGQCQYIGDGITNANGVDTVCDALGDNTPTPGDDGLLGTADDGNVDPDGITEAEDPRELTFNRKNFRIGDAESEQFALSLNAGLALGAGDLYSFVTYSERESESAGFYRRANQTSNNPTLADGDAFRPDGFLPKINTQIDDVSIGLGYKTVFGEDMTVDVSYTYGENNFEFNIKNSVNASFVNLQRFGNGLTDEQIRSSVPDSADAGELTLGLQTFNVDFTKPVGPFNLAWGAEVRTDDYEIEAGDEYSYLDYDTDAAGDPLFAADGNSGIQVFPGFAPSNEVDESRDIWSVYLDAEYDITEALLVSAAVRYDDYDDFGDTTNGKLAARYTVNDWLKVRAAASTGFRAPSMQQQFFNNISTQFVDVLGTLVAQERGTFRNDSALAQAIGIPELKEEESINQSVGLVIQPSDDWTLTVDYYHIDIEDRIVLSGGLSADSGDATLTALLDAANVSSAQFFLNGADTRTEGVDIVSRYNVPMKEGELIVSAAANFTNTNVTDTFTAGGLATLDPSDVFTAQDISIIEEWQPEDRINLTFDYSRDRFSAVVSMNRYGQYTVCEGSCTVANSQTFSSKILTDLILAYRLTEGLTVRLGGNNIFDETPDENEIGQSRTGTIEDASGNTVVDSAGVFQFSRRSAPFGFNGAYFYAGISYDF